MRYQKSAAWNLLMENGRLILTRGGDEIYLIDDVEGEAAELLYQAYQKNSIDELIQLDKNTLLSEALTQALRRAISQLEQAGVIYRQLIKDNISELKVAICWQGNESAGLMPLLREFTASSPQLILTDALDEAGLIIFIRTSKRLLEITTDYQKLTTPHLLIDLAFDHTISLGPLVFPGYTACLSCFVGRIVKNWGDAEPPSMPNAGRHIELIASLIIEQVRKFQQLQSCPELIEKVISFNLSDFTTQTDHVYRLPWCPHCFPAAPQEGMGAFELPWRIKESQQL